jgi:hypothetical protein
MPTVRHNFDKRLIGRGQMSRRNVWGSNQRRARRNHPLGILMIKTLPMIMICVRGDG